MPLQRFVYQVVFLLCALSIVTPARPQEDKVAGQKEISRGSRALISWQFESADYVMLSGDTTHFPRTFQLYVSPSKTTTYVLHGFRGNDSTELSWTVRVTEPELPKVAQRGPESAGYSIAPKASSELSPYYVGYQPTGTLQNIANMKIVHVEYPDSTRSLLSLHTVFLDRNGNQLSMLPSDQLAISLFSKCNAMTTEYQPIISEEKWIRSDMRMMMTVCMDRSSTSEESDVNLRKAVADFPFYLGSSDKLSVVSFNQEPRMVCTHLTKDRLNNLSDLFSGDARGLNALYKAAYMSLHKLEPRDKCTNVMVIITTGVDNASFIYTAEDIVQKALLRHTRVYTIGVGDMVDTYPLRYIASQTGGRYYALATDRATDVTGILREINYAVHGSYVLQIPMKPGVLRSCDSATISLRLKTADTTLLEHYSWAANKENTLPRYQALALFGFRQTDVAEEFSPLLRSVAQVLKDNPKKIVELSGHSNAEGDEDGMRQLSLQRVQSVRTFLLAAGVDPAQIRGKAMGDLKPIYYFQQDDWQKLVNRRVEIRWLDPSILPFELVADYSYTETEALKFTETWEKRGFKAYYERVLVQGQPAFRVKLWGYPTEDKAAADASGIRKKFNQHLELE